MPCVVCVIVGDVEVIGVVKGCTVDDAGFKDRVPQITMHTNTIPSVVVGSTVTHTQILIIIPCVAIRADTTPRSVTARVVDVPICTVTHTHL